MSAAPARTQSLQNWRLNSKKEMSSLFLSHAWEADCRGRDTHARARCLAQALVRAGWPVWFDEYDILCGNIDHSIARGIDSSAAVLVCLTEAYLRKVDYGLSCMQHRDNCAKEWRFIAQSRKVVLPVVFDASLLHGHMWPCSVVSLYLGGTLYVDASEDNWDCTARLISNMLFTANVVKPRYSSYCLMLRRI